MQKLLVRLKIDSLIHFGIAAILIAVPLYPKFPFINVPGIYVSIRIEDFLILAVSVLWLIRNFSRLVGLWKNSIARAIFLFLITAFLATLAGIIFLHTTSPLIGILAWARRFEYLIGFFIAITSIKSVKDVQFYVKCVGIVLFLVFLFGVGQKHLGLPVITTQNSEYSKGIALRYVEGGHLASTFAGHYDMATYIILTSPIFVSLLFLKKEALRRFLAINDKLARGIIFLVVAVSFWLMVNAAHRISTVSYVIAVSATLFLLRKYKYIIVAAIITFIFALRTSNLFDRYLNIFEVLRDRLGSFIPVAHAAEGQDVSSAVVPVLEDRSTAIRLNVEWPRALRAFLKNPLFGTGYGSITLATDNDYLRALGETGLLGLLAGFFVLFRIVKEFIIKSWPGKLFAKKEIDFRTAFLAGVIGAIPGILSNAIFTDVFEASKFAISFWFMMGFGIAIIRLKEE